MHKCTMHPSLPQVQKEKQNTHSERHNWKQTSPCCRGWSNYAVLGMMELVWESQGYQGGSLRKCRGLQELEMKSGVKQGKEGRKQKSSSGLAGQQAAPGHLAGTQAKRKRRRRMVWRQ